MITLFNQFADRIQCRFLGKNDDRNIPDPHVRLWQIHGRTTIVTREPSNNTEKADGVITDRKGLHLIVKAADCQNFAIYAPKHHVGGVLHCGWKGLMQDAILAFFATLKDAFTIDASECFVAAGPSLCVRCAEFKDAEHEFRVQVDAQYLENDHIDLQQIALDQLVQSGVHKDHIERHTDCTCCKPDTYFTYRGGDREDVQSGMSNILVLTLL